MNLKLLKLPNKTMIWLDLFSYWLNNDKCFLIVPFKFFHQVGYDHWCTSWNPGETMHHDVGMITMVFHEFRAAWELIDQCLLWAICDCYGLNFNNKQSPIWQYNSCDMVELFMVHQSRSKEHRFPTFTIIRNP